MSLKNIILNHLKSEYPNWVDKGKLGKLAVNEWGYENENLGRRCRDLMKEGLIEVKYEPNKQGIRCAVYRWLPPKEIINTINNFKSNSDNLSTIDFKVQKTLL